MTETGTKDERVTISLRKAIAALGDRERIHTFRNPAVGMMVGADWPREHVLAALRNAERIDVTGEMAQGMKHGLAVRDNVGLLFIETIHRTDEAAATTYRENEE